MIPDELGDYIRRRAYALDMTLTETARRAGITRQALYKLLDQRVTEARLSTLIKIARALNVHPLALIRRLFGTRQFPLMTTRDSKYSHDHAGFIRDATFPDNETVLVNQEFEKKWEIQNLGEVEWVDRKLVCMDDELYIVRRDNEEVVPVLDQNLIPLDHEVAVPSTSPGKTALISIRFKAPAFPCTTISYWKMVDKETDVCFPQMKGLWCKVNVAAV